MFIDGTLAVMALRFKHTKSDLRGRRVVITGAARGIGAALAQRLTERGAKVALAGLEPELLAAVATRLDAPWFECDVTDEGAVDALEPERVLLLPDGVEDLWGADYKDLVALA